jgi:ATP-dependent protease ClpP protease subunit
MLKQRNEAEDEDEVVFNSEYLGYVNKSYNVNNLSFAIDEGVREPKYYRNIIEQMQNLTPEDTVQIRITSVGGRLDGLLALMEAIRVCDAQILAIIAGECYSAASILALNCPNVIVSPYATMMVHNVSYGTAGKNSDIIGMVAHTTDFCNKLFVSTYRGFLSDKEIDEVLNGKELWFQAEEIEQRLEKRMKHLNKMNKPVKKSKTPVVVSE